MIELILVFTLENIEERKLASEQPVRMDKIGAHGNAQAFEVTKKTHAGNGVSVEEVDHGVAGVGMYEDDGAAALEDSVHQISSPR